MKPKSENITWKRYPEAEAFILERIQKFGTLIPTLAKWQALIMEKTSTRLTDYLDSLRLAGGKNIEGELKALGFEEDTENKGEMVLRHRGAMFPAIRLVQRKKDETGDIISVFLRVENIADFQMALGLSNVIEGSPMSPYRQAVVHNEKDREIVVVERRATRGFEAGAESSDSVVTNVQLYEQWAQRQRQFSSAQQGLASTLKLAESMVRKVGQDTAAWLAFAGERAYWQQHNRAGQVQKRRQDTLGLGWANHDHHTFRSSRSRFQSLIRILETFGFRTRERFYAGKDAGWGAQVLEQPRCDLVVFADVDLAPGEVEMDFAHQALPARDELGTVGLWCQLHGESILEAGLHHLAARFSFKAATNALQEENVELMAPFSDFEYLRQAFTRGETWKIPGGKLAALRSKKILTEEQFSRFLAEGAIGSHLENIERAQGFKGFNQDAVSDIIRRTDPRTGFGAA